MNINLKKI